MEPTDVTIEILKGIREEARRTNERLDELRTEVRSEIGGLRTELRSEVGALRTEMTQLRTDLLDRQRETELRLATELVEVAGAVREVREVRDLLREDRALRDRVDDHERRIAAIERRPA